MAVSLVGEVVNSCDATTGFNAGNISGDDDFVEGTGALGIKASSTTQELYTTSLGATAPYDFSGTGGEDGYHVIMWFNTKTPIDTKANGGLAIIVGNGTSRGKWYVRPAGFYKGGFITRVVNTAADFDNIAAGTWTLTGNPGQLSNVTQMGGGFVTTTSIMGSFNNVQIDQIVIGLGVRVDAGTTGSPNSLETVRSQDEDTNFWGWWGSLQGTYVGKGKLFIGPATGNAVSVFRDTGAKVVFAEEDVASGFYEFDMRGAATEVTWELCNIAIGGTARWGLTLDSGMGSTSGGFTDSQSIFTEYGTITLNQYASLTGTTFVTGTSVVQNGALLSEVTLLEPDVANNVAAIEVSNPANIQNCEFNANAAQTGHALEITVAGTYTFTGNKFNNYLGVTGSNTVENSGSAGAAILNSSGGSVVLNITGGGDTPSIRNSGAGSVTTVNNNTTVTLTGMKDNTEVRVLDIGTTITFLAGIENATAGTVDNRSFSFSLGVGTVVDIAIFNEDWLLPPNNRLVNFTIPSLDTTIPISQIVDRTKL